MAKYMALRKYKFIFLIFLIVSCSKGSDFSKLREVTKLYLDQQYDKPIKSFDKNMLKDFNYKIIEIKPQVL